MKKLRKMNKKTCQYCNGYGEYEDSYDDMFGWVGTHTQSCDACEGKGHVLVKKKHCNTCGTRIYVEPQIKDCDECGYVHTLKEFETSLQDDKFGFLP